MKTNKINYKFRHHVPTEKVLSELKKYMLIDGFEMVLDLENSPNSYFTDKLTGKRFSDFFTCFASLPLGLNHPKLMDPDFINYLGSIAVNKPSNSDLYSESMATFVRTFFKIAVPKSFKYSFYISGGALAVENALKVAFDWKVRKNFAKGLTTEKGHQIIHFKQAFHGRSGYTMSLTNTDPMKTMYYPKFEWPRIDNPKIMFPLNEENLQSVIERENLAIGQIKDALKKNPDDIAAIILEPVQGEGGDNHFRPEFLKQIRVLADENDVMLIFDEVQTGVGITGTMWVHEQLGVTPDIMVFGKKMQTCGIIATERVDEVPENVFHTSSRINSTWGGNLVDMVRATKYLEIIEEEKLLDNVNKMGYILLSKMNRLADDYKGLISNVRGKGLFCAFDLPTAELRNEFRNDCFESGMLILACGEKSMRFRPPLNLNENVLNEGFEILNQAMKKVRANHK